MLKKLRLVSSIIVTGLALFSMITGNMATSPYLLLFLSIAIMLTGILELQRDRKAFWGYMSIGVSLFVLLVSIQGFLLS
ncbi:DUF3953 domain-containing protein [Alkalihalobacterium chitinilyticum]|uniref:DUF3953 domain-containing protein n=1 Tax=Alkalihalobacterium chitinilyticum TaxID=2980103 RepID=A0ABT5VCV9_9BACI|nr:DUF3953 domain-containing protein [Alkalihalobacterium chitinilyticum]MDE5413273.1 DUF3953 domain-containing protein [Alkalihalobacterium chitinilyticum]